MDDKDLNEAFEGINKKLNMSFNSEDDEDKELKDDNKETSREIEVLKDLKKDLQEAVSGMVLGDQEYMRKEIKLVITSAKTVMKKLETDIKVGSHPRSHEVYAKMVQSVTDALRELRELNKTILDVKKEGNENSGGNGKKIALTGSQLLDLIDNARKNSQMNAIEADFTIDESEDLK